MKRKAFMVMLVVLLAFGGGALFAACDEEDAPGAARRGFKYDAQNSDLELYVDGTKIVEFDDTGTEVTITGDLSTSATATFGTGATITTGDWTNSAGGNLVGWQPDYEGHGNTSSTLAITEIGKINTNTGRAAGNTTLTLPVSSTAGDQYTFVVTVAAALGVVAPAGGAIYLDGTKGTDAELIWADDEGESILLVAIGSNDWVAYNRIGTWAARVAW